MEEVYWTHVISCWLNESKFIEPISLETIVDLKNTNIAQFFSKFRELFGAPSVDQNDVVRFVKDNYPDFDIKLDAEGHLCPSDFHYIYSLLLHFSCVKKADERFQEICKKLPNDVQQSIAVFFGELVQSDTLKRENIDRAIRKTAWEKPCYSFESPVCSPSKNNLSPPTPRTLLEDKTREMHVIKAQLETERYMKSLLEAQVEEYKTQNQNLLKTQKSTEIQIKNLQNELFLSKYESNAEIEVHQNSGQNSEKATLTQEVSRLEAEILNFQKNQLSLENEIMDLKEKLSDAEATNRNYLTTTESLCHAINVLEEKSMKKDLTIQSLQETNKELERCVQETRGMKSVDLNSTEDFDFSYQNTSLSSGSLRSPENLACSVIDVQLKEKQNENNNLLEKISIMEGNEQRFCKDIYDLIESLSTLNIPMPLKSGESNLDEGISTLKDLTMKMKMTIEKYESLLKTFINSIREKCQNMGYAITYFQFLLEDMKSAWSFISERAKMLIRQNVFLEQSFQDSCNNANKLEIAQEQLHEMLTIVNHVNTTNEKLYENNTFLMEEIFKYKHRHVFMVEEFNNMKNSLDSLKRATREADEKTLTSRITILEENFKGLRTFLNHMQKEISDEKQNTDEANVPMTKELIVRCSQLEEEKQTLSKKLIEAKDEITNLQHSREEICFKVKYLEEQIEKRNEDESSMEEELLNMKRELCESKNRVEELESQKAVLKIEKESLQQQYHDKTHELDNHLLKSSSLEAQLQRLENEILKNSEKQKEAEHERIVLQQNLLSANEEKISIKENLQKDIDILKAKLIKKRQFIEEREQKWKEDAQKILEFEEHTRATRLEFDGKLNKIKEKMTAIYNEEVEKVMKKYTKAMEELQNKIKESTATNARYEEIINNLSQQISHLNETISMSKKQKESNPFLDNDSKLSKSFPAKSQKERATPNEVMNADLKMEDEEGEIFNNTYLADLKTGQTSSFSESIGVRELLNRNSMCPPHLRSRYAAQYPEILLEDDLKEPYLGNSSDSLLSLLPTGTKKKSNTTSHKRPGSPTPSKHASQLSLESAHVGQSSQVLKELSDNDNAATSATSSASVQKATPGRLKTFFSTKHRDENSTPRRRLYNIFKKK